MYYQTCLFAIELTAKAARTLIEEHRSIEQTLQGRGEIDEDIEQQLRQNVYVLQMNTEAE